MDSSRSRLGPAVINNCDIPLEYASIQIINVFSRIICIVFMKFSITRLDISLVCLCPIITLLIASISQISICSLHTKILEPLLLLLLLLVVVEPKCSYIVRYLAFISLINSLRLMQTTHSLILHIWVLFYLCII